MSSTFPPPGARSDIGCPAPPHIPISDSVTHNNTTGLSPAIRLSRLFAGRDDVYGTFTIIGKDEKTGKVIGRADTVTGDLLIRHWELHVAGKQGLGIVPIQSGSKATCVFGAIDIDLKYLTKEGKTPAYFAQRIKDLGLPLIATYSKSEGVHLWHFVKDPISTIVMMDRLAYYKKELELPADIEIFPKQSSFDKTDKGKGCWINICYFGEGRRLCPGQESVEDFLDLAERTAIWCSQALAVEADPEDDQIDEEPGSKPSVEELIARAVRALNGETKGVKKGVAGRNDAAFSFFMWMRDYLYTRAEAHAAIDDLIKALNAAKPDTPLYSSQEARPTLRSVYSIPPRPKMTKVEDFPRGFYLKDRPFNYGGAVLAEMVDKEGKKHFWRVCTPIKVERICRDVDTNEVYRLLKLRDCDGKVIRILLAARDIGPKIDWKAELRAVADFRVYDQRVFESFWSNYHPEGRGIVATRVGWCGPEKSIFVLPEKSFGSNEPVDLIDVRHRLYVHGTAAEWRDHIGSLCRGNNMLVFAANIAFTAVLAPLTMAFGKVNPGFHLYGETSLGKTTAQWIAGSVVGGTSTGDHYWRTFNSTVVGFEMQAALHNCLPLILDEIGVADGAKLGDMIYQFSQGEGRNRGTAKIQAARTPTWDGVLLTSGEKIPEDMIRESGRTPRGGQAVRLLNIPATKGKYGLFDSLHDISSGEEFSNTLKKRAGDYYGAPLREFLEKFIPRRDEMLKQFESRAIELARIWAKKGTAEVPRAAQSFALVAAAGEIAAALGVTGFSAEECRDSAEKAFHLWLADRGTTGSSDAENWVKQVRKYIAEGWLSRFEDLDDTKRQIVTKDGSTTLVDKDRARLNIHAGYRQQADDGEIEIWVKTETFQRELCEGYDHRAVAQELSRRGILCTELSERLQCRRTPPNEGREYFYVLAYSKLMDSEKPEKYPF